MGKNFNQWLDEFVDNGADAKDVTNWPENGGGGQGGGDSKILGSTLEMAQYLVGKHLVVDNLLALIEKYVPNYNDVQVVYVAMGGYTNDSMSRSLFYGGCDGSEEILDVLGHQLNYESQYFNNVYESLVTYKTQLENETFTSDDFLNISQNMSNYTFLGLNIAYHGFDEISFKEHEFEVPVTKEELLGLFAE